MFLATAHAIQRFTERFAGNLSESTAQRRIEKIAQHARYIKDVPGHAKLYATQGVAFIVKDGHIITVYPRSSKTCNTTARQQAALLKPPRYTP